MKKNNIFLILFVALLFNTLLHSQPYYYTAKYELVDSVFRNFTTDIYRINMSNPVIVETLMTNIAYRSSAEADEYGNWLAYTEPNNLLSIMNLNNPTQKNVISEYSEGVIKLSYASAVNKLVVLYLGNYSELYKLILVDPSTLTVVDSIPYDIRWEISTNEDFIFSKTGDVMYLMKTDTVLQKGYIASYSLISNQIVKTKYLSEIYYPGKDHYYFNYRLNGLSVMESLFSLPTPTSYYQIYFLDQDSLSIPIVHDNNQSWADGYVSSEGKYLLLFNSQLNLDSSDQTYTGKIDIYDMTDGELEKTIQLPSDGKVMCFENYPNNVYYTKDIELPFRQVWILKMDSIFNVLNLTGLNPTSQTVNSLPFTLSVNGHGFDTVSTVYFNGDSKTTSYISDSVLTAEILSSDISQVGNYPVWVTDQYGISDTLVFEVTPEPPVINTISPALALPYFVLPMEPNVLTITINGEFFTDSTVAYFNGISMFTTFVSDSVVTISLNSRDFRLTGNYPISVTNYGAVSDTVNFTVTDSLPQTISPVLTCVHNNGDRTFTAHFGYYNYNSVPVAVIPSSGNNYFSPGDYYRGQPNIYLPGFHSDAFTVVFDGDNLTWNLLGHSVTVSKKSTPCQ